MAHPGNNYNLKECLACKNKFKPQSVTQLYCGSLIDDKSCSYKRMLERNRLKAKFRRLALRFAVLKKSKFRCQYCSRKPPKVELQIDHITQKGV